MKTFLFKKRFVNEMNNPWRYAGLILVGVIMASCFGGCGKSDRIVIRGSNTFGEELAPHLIAEFKKEHASVEFDSEFKGTTYGLGALLNGNCDIAAASRPVTTNEMALAPGRGVEFNDYIIGSYAVAVVVHAGNMVANLTQVQVRDIFTGVVQNWKEVGGVEAPIHLYIRSPISGTYLGFQELAMEKKPYGTQIKSLSDYAGICQAVANDSNGIGYSNIDMSKQRGIKSLSIGGVTPSLESVNQGSYPYARTLRLYTHKASERANAGAFAKFTQSSAGRKIVGELGYVPKP